MGIPGAYSIVEQKIFSAQIIIFFDAKATISMVDSIVSLTG